MIITLIILSFILGGYSLYLIKKSQKETNIYIDKKIYDLEVKLHEKSLYLLDELDNKIKSNQKLILKEFRIFGNGLKNMAKGILALFTKHHPIICCPTSVIFGVPEVNRNIIAFNAPMYFSHRAIR